MTERTYSSDIGGIRVGVWVIDRFGLELSVRPLVSGLHIGRAEYWRVAVQHSRRSGAPGPHADHPGEAPPSPHGGARPGEVPPSAAQ